MLTRISEIQGIGLLHDANGKPHTCQKATLIYGDNGRGKSTLAAILRSVSTGDAALITERKTIDGTLPPKVTLQFENGHKVTFENGTWSEQRPDVLVFDAEFIERNVHSGGSVEPGHRKNLLEFALGEDAVLAREAEEKASEDARTAGKELRALAEQASVHHNGMTLAAFSQLPNIPDAETQVITLQKNIAAAENAAALLARPIPVAPIEPLLDLTAVFDTLATSLDDVQAGAEQTVKQHIAKLGKPPAETWLSQGQVFGTGDSCPYCDQDTSNSMLIQAYRTHFNAAYSQLKATITTWLSKVNASTDRIIVASFASGVAAAEVQMREWADHVRPYPIAFDAEEAHSALLELRALVLDLLQRKQMAPGEPLGNVAERDVALALWQRMLAPMQAASTAVMEARAMVTTYKAQLANGNTQDLQRQLRDIQASQRRHDPAIAALLHKHDLAADSLRTAEAAKKRARKALDVLMDTTLKQYSGAINEVLAKKLNTSFCISPIETNYKGGVPHTEYFLELRGKSVALKGGSPSFTTALSEGDRRALAFAFFIARTLKDPQLASRCIVVDDPMCSLDVNRKHGTKSLLKDLHAGAAQLIVLAHDIYFIKDLRDSLLKVNAAPVAFQLADAAGDYTGFKALDIDRKCESEYCKHHRLLSDFATAQGDNAEEVAKAIRPMLEGYLHRRFPRAIPTGHMFGEAVVLIRDAVAPSPLRHAQALVKELNEINTYAGQFHHDTNPSGFAHPIAAPELKHFVVRALDLVHGKA